VIRSYAIPAEMKEIARPAAEKILAAISGMNLTYEQANVALEMVREALDNAVLIIPDKIG